ncbi:MAG: hypothetical protein R3Y35_09120 [Clostridia bacterium]
MSNFLTLVKFEYIKIFKSKFNIIFIVALFGLMIFLSYNDISNIYFSVQTDEGYESYRGIEAIQMYKEIVESGAGEMNEEWLGTFYDDMQNDMDKNANNNAKYGIFYNLYYQIMNKYTVYSEDESEDEQQSTALSAISREEFIENFNADYKEVYKSVFIFYNYSEEKTEYLYNQIDEIEEPLYFGYTDGYTFFFNKQQEFALMLLILISILSANIFSSEYSLKTDTFLISSKNGKKSVALAKITCIFSLTTLIYLIITAMQLILTKVVYGFEHGNTAYFLSIVFGKSFNDTTVLNVLIVKILVSILVCLVFSIFGAMLSQLIKNQIATIITLLTISFFPFVVESMISLDLTDLQNNIIALFPAYAQYDYKLFGNNLYMLGNIHLNNVFVVVALYSVLAVAFTIITHNSFKKQQLN